ncbi:TIM-barrel domain-containing protein [Lacticaseibacillus hulanensis]|uniref:TIM-barrel domain-containing protein n=1 Tax=Lacticaseibacillus hulanensis TaxID=2493111 RepID=UPI000FDC6233|nr:TIM-barrel domain-containing protein [Lacticaseibacillus hulanensis]
MPENPNAIHDLANPEGTITFTYHNWHARISAVNDHIVRLTVTSADSWPTQPSIPAAVTTQKHADATVATGGSGQEYQTPIVINHDSQALVLSGNTAALGNYLLTITDGSLSIAAGQDLLVRQSLPQLVSADAASADPDSDVKTAHWSTTIKTRPHAHYFGGGTQNGIVTLNDRLIQIRNENRWTLGGVSSPVPFFWSTTGYGFLSNTFTPGTYDFSNPHFGARLLHEDAVYDGYLILGQTPTAIIHGYHELTGLPALMPRFTFYPAHFNAYNRDYWVAVTPDSSGAVQFEDGNWYKEYQPVNPETFNTGYRPGTITVAGQTLIPNVYGSGNVTFTDADASGNPKSAIHESLNGEHDYQFSARAVIDRYQNAGYPLGWLLPNDGYGAGYGQTNSFSGDLANLAQFIEYARAHGVATGLWTQKAVKPQNPEQPAKGERDLNAEIAAGVRALKTDVAWVGEGYTFGLNATTKAASALNDAGLRPAIVTLDGWAGSQRSSLIWTGDQAGSNWRNIKSHIGSYLSSGLSGNPNIASDVDGIYAGSDPIVQTRDLQWKAFTPTFFAMDGWGDVAKHLGLEFGDQTAAINRAYLEYHTSLVPFLYSLAANARLTGQPIMRPTWWLEQNDYTYSDDLNDQLLLGDAFLIAPITTPYHQDERGNAERASVYLPTGDWTDFWSGREYNGGTTISNVPAPLGQTPIFVRAGSIVPLVAPHMTPDQLPNTRRLDYYPGYNQSSFVQYDDDGQTPAYAHGKQAQTRIDAIMDDGDTVHITIHATTGTFAGQELRQATTVFIPCSTEPRYSVVQMNGELINVPKRFGMRAGDPFAAMRTETGFTIEIPAVNISANTFEIEVGL